MTAVSNLKQTLMEQWSLIQSRTQSLRASWSAGERPEKLWENRLELYFWLATCVAMAVLQEVGK